MSRYLKERMSCLFRGHEIPANHLVHETGALFRGGICTRCKRFRMGPFIMNAWDESLTEQDGHVISFKGVNPRIAAEGWVIMGDAEVLQELSERLIAGTPAIEPDSSA